MRRTCWIHPFTALLVGALGVDAVAACSVPVECEQEKLRASDSGAGDFFGSAAALSGDRLLIGAHQHDHVAENAGAAFVFRFDGSSWVQEQELLPPGLSADDFFGLSVAIDGLVAVVGAPLNPTSPSGPGSAYVLRFDGLMWNCEAELTPSVGSPGDAFGEAVAVSGDVALIGAGGSDANGVNSGAAFVFRRVAGRWIEEAMLVGSDTAALDAFAGHVGLRTEPR